MEVPSQYTLAALPGFPEIPAVVKMVVASAGSFALRLAKPVKMAGDSRRHRRA
jgi:hypothetical protein